MVRLSASIAAGAGPWKGRGAIAWAGSVSWLQTQFGEAGQGARRPAWSPGVGRALGDGLGITGRTMAFQLVRASGNGKSGPTPSAAGRRLRTSAEPRGAFVPISRAEAASVPGRGGRHPREPVRFHQSRPSRILDRRGITSRSTPLTYISGVSKTMLPAATDLKSAACSATCMGDSASDPVTNPGTMPLATASMGPATIAAPEARAIAGNNGAARGKPAGDTGRSRRREPMTKDIWEIVAPGGGCFASGAAHHPGFVGEGAGRAPDVP